MRALISEPRSATGSERSSSESMRTASGMRGTCAEGAPAVTTWSTTKRAETEARRDLGGDGAAGGGADEHDARVVLGHRLLDRPHDLAGRRRRVGADEAQPTGLGAQGAGQVGDVAAGADALDADPAVLGDQVGHQLLERAGRGGRRPCRPRARPPRPRRTSRPSRGRPTRRRWGTARRRSRAARRARRARPGRRTARPRSAASACGGRRAGRRRPRGGPSGRGCSRRARSGRR